MGSNPITPTMNKNIVLNLDGVIADIDTSVSEYLHYDCGISLDYSKWITTNTKDKEALHLFSKKIFWKNLKPFEDSWYKCNEWFSKNIDIHIISTRKEEIKQITDSWLDEWGIGYNKIHYCNFGKKLDVISSINPVFVIENNPSEIKKIEKAGFKCYLRKSWYNKTHWKTMDSVDSLYDIRFEQ